MDVKERQNFVVRENFSHLLLFTLKSVRQSNRLVCGSSCITYRSELTDVSEIMTFVLSPTIQTA